MTEYELKDKLVWLCRAIGIDPYLVAYTKPDPGRIVVHVLDGEAQDMMFLERQLAHNMPMSVCVSVEPALTFPMRSVGIVEPDVSGRNVKVSPALVPSLDDYYRGHFQAAISEFATKMVITECIQPEVYGGICRHCGGHDEYPLQGSDGKVCCWHCHGKH